MDPYEIIIRPVDTEKTRYQASDLRQYAFEVADSANKIEVKRAIEKMFNVNVTSVNTMNVAAKIGRRYGRRRVIRRATWKKAVVTLAEGQRLDVFEGV